MARRTAIAVIGAGYGDEGKGLMVDALAASAATRPVVVRFNGGAQAGHTVALANGSRHVFHHIGAGALAGAATHLSRFFVHHPMLLEVERQAVFGLGGCTELSADPRGLVTTPWDMLINQAAERLRGDNRHGSCGLGFGETIERGEHAPFALRVGDLRRPGLRQRLDAVRRNWAPRRLAALGVGCLTEREAAILADDGVVDVYLEDCRRFNETVTLRDDAALGRCGSLIFEGAQGLMLDQAIGTFPHVTRSHTGLVNVAATAREAELERVDAIYVTRAYATRHGAGPLPGAAHGLDGIAVSDPTNQPNDWQGRMRYAPLDLDRLDAAITADGRLADLGPVSLRTSLAVTCLDQATGLIRFVHDGSSRSAAPSGFAATVGRLLRQPVDAQSWGATRDHVEACGTALRAA